MSAWEWVRCVVFCAVLGGAVAAIGPPWWAIPLVGIGAGAAGGALDSALFPRR